MLLVGEVREIDVRPGSGGFAPAPDKYAPRVILDVSPASCKSLLQSEDQLVENSARQRHARGRDVLTSQEDFALRTRTSTARVAFHAGRNYWFLTFGHLGMRANKIVKLLAA